MIMRFDELTFYQTAQPAKSLPHSCQSLWHDLNTSLHRGVNAADILVHARLLEFVPKAALGPQCPGEGQIAGRDGVHDHIVTQPLDLGTHLDRQVILLKRIVGHIDLALSHLRRGRVLKEAMNAENPILT